MITEDKNSLESKVILSIKTVFDDLTERIVNSTFENDFARQTTSLYYIFKKDGGYEVLDFTSNCTYKDFYQRRYHKHFNSNEFNFSIKICNLLYLSIVDLVKTNHFKTKTTTNFEGIMKEICFEVLTQLSDKNYVTPIEHFGLNMNGINILLRKSLKYI